MPTLNEIISNISDETVAEYQATSEKFTFVIDYLNDRDYYISAHDRKAEAVVNLIEDHMDERAGVNHE